MPPNLQLSSASSIVSKKGKSPAQKGQSWVLSFLSWRSSKKKETGPRAGSARSCFSCTIYLGEFRELYTDFGLWGNLKNVEPCPGHIALDAIDLIGDLPAATLCGGGHRPASYPASYTDIPTPYLWPHHTSCDTFLPCALIYLYYRGSRDWLSGHENVFITLFPAHLLFLRRFCFILHCPCSPPWPRHAHTRRQAQYAYTILFFFNWGTVDLQYCVSSGIQQSDSVIYANIHSFSDSLPI